MSITIEHLALDFKAEEVIGQVAGHDLTKVSDEDFVFATTDLSSNGGVQSGKE